MKWESVAQVEALYELGYRVVRTQEWFCRPPKSASAEFKRLVKADRMWNFMVPCRKGRSISGVKAHIYSFSPTHYAYTGVGMRLRKRLLEIAGVRSHQTGDEEFTVVFPSSALATVAEDVLPHRRPSKEASKSAGIEGFVEGSLNAEASNEVH